MLTTFAATDALKSAACKVAELTDTGFVTEVTDPIELPNVKVNLSPGPSVSGVVVLFAEAQTNALDAWPAGNIDGLTLNVTLELCAPAQVTNAAISTAGIAARISIVRTRKILNMCSIPLSSDASRSD
jgi:hypothetical protein